MQNEADGGLEGAQPAQPDIPNSPSPASGEIAVLTASGQLVGILFDQ